MSVLDVLKGRLHSSGVTVGTLGFVVTLGYLLGRTDASKDGSVEYREPKDNSSVLESETPIVAAEQGHGRLASTPSEFGARAWKDILLRTYDQLLQDRITTVAAGIALFGLLALFPGIAALVSLYGLVADPSTIRDHLFQLSFILPPNAFSIVEDQIKRVVEQGGNSLSLKFAFGLCLSLWSANAAMKAMLDGLNVAYEEEEKRSFLVLNALTLAMTLFALAGLLVIIACAAILPSIGHDNATYSSAETALTYLRWPAMFALITVGLSLLYRFGPSRTRPKWRWVTWGSIAAAFAVVAISVLLNWYLTSFADYNKTYGSLGAVIGLITWLWLAGCAVLIGGELNGEMEHQTARDSTVEPSKPMGERGAKMADTLGRSAA